RRKAGRRADRLSVGGHRVPGTADALAVDVPGRLVTGEGVDRPAVDRLLLDPVGPGEAHQALLHDALGVVRGDGRDRRPLLQAGTGAVRHRLGPRLVLQEAVDRHAVLVDDD